MRGSRTVTPVKRASLPPLCRECHAPATFREVEERPIVIVRRDGAVTRTTQLVTVYWCDRHTGITPP